MPTDELLLLIAAAVGGLLLGSILLLYAAKIWGYGTARGRDNYKRRRGK